ncbi:MAG: MGMT family protein [Endomicrobiia bacterium]|nr:MGMT family protein [Endomicrobiia bacterium]
MKPSAKILDRPERYPAFYRKVWIECAKIPDGETRTYSEIARAVGSRGAARAVGRALAANPFAPEIPCHRVIRADGKPGGYSGAGGIRKKIALLKKERARK